MRYTKVCWAAAKEFDDGGSRITHRRGKQLFTTYHSSSFSRSVERLEDREYIRRQKSQTSRRWQDRQTRWIVATDKGLRAGWEAIRRHRDGRYSLSFDTLE